MKLRAANLEDIDFILNQEARPEFNDFIFRWSRDTHLQNLQDPNKAYLMVENISDEVPNVTIGYSILSGIQSLHRTVELTRIVIAEPGRGLGRKALKLIQKRVFEEYRAHRLWLDVFESNYRARRAYELVGFRQEGILREAIRRGKAYDSLVIMSILEQEYA